jgi:hypothetical protein
VTGLHAWQHSLDKMWVVPQFLWTNQRMKINTRLRFKFLLRRCHVDCLLDILDLKRHDNQPPAIPLFIGWENKAWPAMVGNESIRWRVMAGVLKVSAHEQPFEP